MRHPDPLALLASVMCADPDVEGLTPQQIASLHVFKHKILAAGYQLYESISVNAARPILIRVLKDVTKELEKGIDPPPPTL